MDQTLGLGPILAAAASFFVVMLLFAAICAACKTNPDHHRRTSRRTQSARDLSTSSSSATFDPSLNRVSMPDLLKATRNFSPDLIIGDGSFGLVYKARLPNAGDLTVAVKKLSPDAFQGLREFRAEMETLSKLRHPNIVTILGYCSSGSDRILIYEFIQRGSLDQWLLDTSEETSTTTRPPLSWETRVKIIKARRIEGSHSHVSTQVAGTMGYMPPEYIQGLTMATAMGDVYSFGILMLEISTGIRPNLPFKEEDGDGKEVRLVEWAKKMVERNRHMEILDANISREEGLNESGVVEFFRIAILCTSDSSKDRPPMREVVELLNQIST
ncbi:hypothetical protein Vadar_025688 [Vaccinium darrowii]|uniref:Uncharacterized protein n=1 Tax=Vaccinium darrowii TaxID=229202 RepID=A0ACB7Y969_9ERIC|nr:hypothetical protein Vadar_025688 [Vaccinium darrowii]